MGGNLTNREAAEAIEQFGDDLAKLSRSFDRICSRMTSDQVEWVNTVKGRDRIDTVVELFRSVGDAISRECDTAEDDRDRAATVNVGGHRDGGSAS